MSDMTHTRMISEDFLNDLRPGGILAPLTELVKGDDELFMAFRGDYINVYYKCHSLYRVEQQKRGYAVTFNFNHARYTENYPNELETLTALGMRLPNRRNKQQGLELPQLCRMTVSNPLTKKITKADPDFWNKTLPIFKRLTEDFFDPGKTYDWFKDKAGLPKVSCVGGKSELKEKRHQQALALRNHVHEGDGIFVYDIEYAQPGSDARFDFLALKVEGGEAKELLLIELKSTLGALKGRSGIEEHSRDMFDYLQSDAIQIRKDESPKILTAYHDLLGVSVPRCGVLKSARAVFAFTGDVAKQEVPSEMAGSVWKQKDDNDWSMQF